MIREDRELLAEMARINSDMAPLAMRIMDGSASAAEQQHYGQRLIAVGERLRWRADGIGATVIEDEVLATETRPFRRIPKSFIGSREQRLENTESATFGTP